MSTRNTALHSVPDGLDGHARNTGPFRGALRLPVDGYPHVITTVLCLLFWRCPSAIGGAVPLAPINSINRMLRAWPWPNVIPKRLVRESPSPAHGNAAPAVSVKVLGRFVLAAVNYSNPYFVECRSRLFVLGQSLGVGKRLKLRAKASAGINPSSPKIDAARLFLRSAFALAKPYGKAIACCPGAGSYGKAAKCLPFKADDFSHSMIVSGIDLRVF